MGILTRGTRILGAVVKEISVAASDRSKARGHFDRNGSLQLPTANKKEVLKCTYASKEPAWDLLQPAFLAAV